ncbi:MAG: hypothetical protein ACI4I9_01350 [Porcipelethomonas sp.]
MFRKIRRILAGIIASAMILTSAGCGVGKDTAYALTVDGYQVRAGIYIYYSYTALNEAKSMAKEIDENIDDTDRKALEKVKLEGKDFMTWVQDKATDTCANHVAVIKQFDELGLSLSDDKKKEITDTVDAAWEQNEKMFEGNGIGRESLEEIITMSYKTEAVFNAYFGEGGSEGVTDDQLKEFYTDNHMRAKYIAMDLHDAEGNELDDAGKKELKDMADDFLKRAKEAGQESQQAMLDEFVVMQEEYDAYVAAQAEAAVDDEDAGSETTEAVTEPETEAETEEETEAETEADEEAADAESDETSDISAEEPTDAPDSEDEAAVTTAPDEEEEIETTTTSPYTNETIINVVTTAADDETSDDEEEKEINYTPSEKAYNWLLDAKYGVPGIVENDDTLYVIVRLDIDERINEDDLWSENNVESVRNTMFSDEFQDLLDGWADACSIVRNDKAYKRYDPFDIKE